VEKYKCIHDFNYSPGDYITMRLVFTLSLFSLEVFVLLVVEIDTGDPEGVTDTISSGKRIRATKRRRALTTCRFLVMLLPTGLCSSATDWGYDGVAILRRKDVRRPKLRGFLSRVIYCA